MAVSLRIGTPPIDVTLRRHARAKRLTLRIAQGTGQVSLTAPDWVSQRQINAFLSERESWLQGKLISQPGPILPQTGTKILLRGALVSLENGSGRVAQLTGENLAVPGEGDAFVAKLLAFLKLSARADLAVACDEYSQKLGKPFSRITLRDTRTRWGSCTSDAGLMFSWRLIMAPPQVLRYVAAHEVAHLAEMNHSPAFWAVVNDLMPDYSNYRNWLRDNGAQLHMYQF